MSHVDLSEFLSGFLAEADEHLRSINANLLSLDTAISRDEPNPRAVRELFRSLHTMKGIAGMVGIEPIVDVAHAMERVLRVADQHGGRVPAEAFNPLLQGAQAIAARVSVLAEGKAVPAAPRELIEALDAIDLRRTTVTGGDVELDVDAAILAKLTASEKEQLTSRLAPPQRALQLTFVPSPERAASGVTITAVRERVARSAEIVRVVPLTAPAEAGGGLQFMLLVTSSASEAALADAAHTGLDQVRVISRQRARPPAEPAIVESEALPFAGAGALRVEVRKVDRAVEGLGELMVSKFRLAHAVNELSKRGVDVRELRELLQDTERKLRYLRSAVLGLRMVSLAELFERLPLLVRGLRSTTGKNVELHMDVGRFEVDKGVGERLWPVLVHTVRNAVDHGLETEAERRAAGKPLQGVISVTCIQKSTTELEISVSDDGSGIDRARVAQRAGVPVPADAAGLLDLITRPGFSTRDAATATSGRGMGLDIARRIVVGELAGEMRLTTELARGTTFTFRVPVTVAVVDAFRFEAAEQAFLVPVASVEEFVQVEANDVIHAPSVHNRFGAAILNRKGKNLPFLELSRVLGRRQARASEKAIIVRRQEQLYAFGVERLIDHHEVVVRPLSDPLVTVPGVAGSADLGDGKPTLLLDLLALSAKLECRERAA